MVQYYEDLYRILSIYHYQWPPSLSHQHVVALIVNWPRDSIIPAALSSHAILVQQESKTRQFFFQPHKCFFATFWHKEHEITWLPEFHVRPLICFEYKSLSNPSKHGQLQKKCNALIAHCSAYKTLSEKWFNWSWKIMMHCTQFFV